MSAKVVSRAPLRIITCAEALTSYNGNNQLVPHQNQNLPLLALYKHSWVIRTESNVRKWVRKKPEPSCVICKGGGRVECYQCLGRGRSNHTHLVMLPKGEWPKWCMTCGGSGLEYCGRCRGTGEYRGPIGFHSTKRHDVQDSGQDSDGGRTPGS